VSVVLGVKESEFSMIIVAGTLRIDPTDRAEYLDAVSVATALARSTPGCLDFAQSADPIEPDRINIFERWESDAHLEAFRDLPGDGGQTPPILGAGVQRYRISSIEPA
jgi:quinol monooxygenase YgiN